MLKIVPSRDELRNLKRHRKVGLFVTHADNKGNLLAVLLIPESARSCACLKSDVQLTGAVAEKAKSPLFSS